jgi:hypothetical protein
MKSLAFFGVILLLTVISITLAGCASIVKGKSQIISIKSNPTDAKLLVYDVRKGNEIINARTPYTATLECGAGYFKKAKYRVVIEKEDYESKEILIEGSVSGWYIGGNFVFGGLIGWLIVDPATGAMWTLDPKDVNADLTKKVSLLQQKEGLMIVLTSKLHQLPESLRDKMKPVN